DRAHEYGLKATGCKQRRGIVKHRKAWRIARLSGSNETHAEAAGGGKLRFRLRHGGDAARPRRAAAVRQVRQTFECGAGAAAVVDQRAEGAWPDMVAADQPQPVEPLCVAQTQWL